MTLVDVHDKNVELELKYYTNKEKVFFFREVLRIPKKILSSQVKIRVQSQF